MNPFNYIVLNLTNRCNTYCKYCFQEANGDCQEDVLTIDLVRDILDYITPRLSDGERRIVHITGGEPMMNNDFASIFYEVVKRGFTVRLQTNGLLLDPSNKDLMWCFAQPNVSAKISLDGSTKEQHEYLRQKGTFDKTVNNIRVLTSINPRIGVKSCIHNKNIDHFQEMLDFCLDLGIAGYSYNIIRDEGYAKIESNEEYRGITEVTVVKKLVPLFNEKRYRHLLNGNQIPLYYFCKGKYLSCGAQFYIDHNGTIYSYQQCTPKQRLGSVLYSDWNTQFDVEKAKRQEYMIPLDREVIEYVKANLTLND